MNKPFIIILGVILFYFLIIIWQDIKKVESLKDLKDTLSSTLNYEQNENKILQKKIVSFDNPDEIELAARRKLGMIKKGERAYKIIINN